MVPKPGEGFLPRPRSGRALRLLGDNDHPHHAEPIRDHAETRRKEGLGQRHLDLPAIAEGGECLLRLGLVLYCERQSKTLKCRLARAATVGRHEGRLADAKTRVHNLVFGARWAHRGFRAVLVAHQPDHLGAKHLAIELKSLIATTFKEQIWLNEHSSSPLSLNCLS